MNKRQERRQRATTSRTSEYTPPSSSPDLYPNHKPSGLFSTIEHFYWEKYKLLMWIPNLLLILAILQISFQLATTGSFLHKGISLQGGLTVTIPTISISDLSPLEEQLHATFPASDIRVRKLSSLTGDATGLIIDADLTERESINAFVAALEQALHMNRSDFSVEEIGSALGGSFFQQTFTSLIIAFLLIGIVVFFYFRTLMPSFAVMFAAFSDMLVTLAVLNIFDVKVSTAGIAAFLMLIGYSIDTDMLLTINVLKKRDGSIKERVYHSIKTGTTMTLTALGAVGAMLLFSGSEVITQIALILFIGLWTDMIYTWIQNVGLLRWYIEHQEKKGISYEQEGKVLS